jgi:hypothetical protein
MLEKIALERGEPKVPSAKQVIGRINSFYILQAASNDYFKAFRAPFTLQLPHASTLNIIKTNN